MNAPTWHVPWCRPALLALAGVLLLQMPLRCPAAEPGRNLATLKAAAESGDAAAQEQLGYAYAWGMETEADPQRARHWLALAAQADRRVAASALAQMLMEGVGGPGDPARARQLFEKAALQGDATAQAALAQLLARENPLSERIVPLLEAAASQGSEPALRYLGGVYGRGVGVTADVERAYKYELRAAQLGHRESEINAAAWQFTKPEDAQAVGNGFALLEHAAGKGNFDAMFVLGMHYWGGYLRPRDGKLATRWLAAAVNAGHPYAGLLLAQCYATGFGVESNQVRAEMLFAATVRTAEAREQNQFAWYLAVSPKAELRDGARAVSIMENLLEIAERRPAYLDTLAAAYAEAGRFADAVQAQLDANGKLNPDMSSKTRAGYEERLALYRAGQPYREAR